MEGQGKKRNKFWHAFRHAFTIEESASSAEQSSPEASAGSAPEFTEASGGLDAQEQALIKKLAKTIVRRRMGNVATLFLESFEPLGYIGSQAMFFLRPFMTFVFSQEEYDRLARILERRSSIQALIAEIHRQENPPQAENS